MEGIKKVLDWWCQPKVQVVVFLFLFVCLCMDLGNKFYFSAFVDSILMFYSYKLIKEG